MAKRAAGTPVEKKSQGNASAPTSLAPASGRFGAPLERREWLTLGIILFAGLLLRLAFMPMLGHATDIGTFEAWMADLAKQGTKAFYSATNFVDYPPGYMLILWLFGQIYRAIVAANGAIDGTTFMMLIKSPAVLADLGIAYLTYLIARRTWTSGQAFIAAGIIAFNPAIWFVSAYWGQADSVAAVFMVWALYLALTDRFEWAWVALSVAVLIKPQPLVVAPLLLFWQVRRQGWTWRIALIPLIALAVAYVGSLPFSPTNDPPGVWVWLYDRYHTGTQVYPYNSANAFNLYSIARDMWQSDTATIIGVHQWVFGVLLFIAFAVAVTMRQWRLTAPALSPALRERAMYLAWFLLPLGLFMLTTRMHERYMFSALALAPLVWNVSRTQRVSILILSATFMTNLVYALAYLKTPSADLNPLLVHSVSFVNVLVLFVLAGAYLIEEMGTAVERRLTGVSAAADGKPAAQRAAPSRAPLATEGLLGLTRWDYLIVLGLTGLSGLLLFYRLGVPNSRIFDEVYFARAAEEYLKALPQFEWTHPPLTKLLMAASAGIFRQLPDPLNARTASATFGMLSIPLLYAFAKRLFSSTKASVLAVFLLLTSGYWYVQSRIATPEIFIAFFSLATLYCFYRLVISSQIVRRATGGPVMTAAAILYPLLFVVSLAFSLFVFSYDANDLPNRYRVFVIPIFFAILSVYSAMRAYRLATGRPKGEIFPDGTRVEGSYAAFASGERMPLRSAAAIDGGGKTTWAADSAQTSSFDATVTWNSDGTIAATIKGRPRRDRQRWLVWFVLAAVAVACLVDSKWEGVMGLVALWFAATFVAAQRWLPQLFEMAGAKRSGPARFAWGNPWGVRWTLFIATSIAISIVVYLVSYIQFFHTGDSHVVSGHGWSALWDLQKQMYWYHHNLRATHPYSSQWWTWPLELRPVSYYFQGFGPPGNVDAVVAEVLALPNPVVWLMGLITVPFAAVYAWRERHKGVMLLVVAYVLQWLPWALSPRIDFEYNFYPNLGIICLCSAYVLKKWWSPAPDVVGEQAASITKGNRALIAIYLVACAVAFAYFFPILSAIHIPYSAWMERMWIPIGPPHHVGWI